MNIKREYISVRRPDTTCRELNNKINRNTRLLTNVEKKGSVTLIREL